MRKKCSFPSFEGAVRLRYTELSVSCLSKYVEGGEGGVGVAPWLHPQVASRCGWSEAPEGQSAGRTGEGCHVRVKGETERSQVGPERHLGRRRAGKAWLLVLHLIWSSECSQETLLPPQGPTAVDLCVKPEQVTGKMCVLPPW